MLHTSQPPVHSPNGKEDFRSDHEGNGSKCQVRRMVNMIDITA
jgi:hypothetical protein